MTVPSVNKNKGSLRSSGTNYYFVAHENPNANGYSTTLTSTMNNTPSTVSNSNSTSSNSNSNYISTVPKFSRSDSMEKSHNLEFSTRSTSLDAKTKYYSGDTNIPPSQLHPNPPIVSNTSVGSSLTTSLLEFNNNSSSASSGSYITNHSANSIVSVHKDTGTNNIQNTSSFNLRSHIDIRKPIDKATAIQSSPPINIPPKAKMGEYIKSHTHASSPIPSEGNNSKSGSVSEQKLDLFRGTSSILLNLSHKGRKFKCLCIRKTFCKFKRFLLHGYYSFKSLNYSTCCLQSWIFSFKYSKQVFRFSFTLVLKLAWKYSNKRSKQQYYQQ